jgi:hypothetical protein
MKIWQKFRRPPWRKVLKRAAAGSIGAAAAGLLGDILIRWGLPAGVAEEVGDGILFVINFLLEG